MAGNSSPFQLDLQCIDLSPGYVNCRRIWPPSQPCTARKSPHRTRPSRRYSSTPHPPCTSCTPRVASRSRRARTICLLETRNALLRSRIAKRLRRALTIPVLRALDAGVRRNVARGNRRFAVRALQALDTLIRRHVANGRRPLAFPVARRRAARAGRTANAAATASGTSVASRESATRSARGFGITGAPSVGDANGFAG